MCRFSESNSREQLRRDEEVWRLDKMMHDVLYSRNVSDHFEIDSGPRLIPGTEAVGFTLHCWFDVTETDYIGALRAIFERVAKNFMDSKWNKDRSRPGQATDSGT